MTKSDIFFMFLQMFLMLSVKKNSDKYISYFKYEIISVMYLFRNNELFFFKVYGTIISCMQATHQIVTHASTCKAASVTFNNAE